VNPKPKQPPVVPALLRLLALLALLAVYFLAGLLLKKSCRPPDQVNLFWPPAGLALAAIVIFGYQFWPAVALGTGVFLFVGGLPVGGFMLVTAAGNTLAALGCAFLLKRLLRFENPHERVRGVAGYLLVAGVFGTGLNAAGNAAGLAGAGKISEAALLPNLLAWCVPNALALLVLAPFLIVWAAPSLWRWNFRSVLEALACLVGLTASTLVAFVVWFDHGIHNYPLAYLPVPFLLWGTFRFGPRGAVTGTFVVSALMFYFLFQGQGFSDANPDTLQTIGSYVNLMAVANLILAAVVAGRRRAEVNLEENEKRLRTVVADQSELICRFLPAGTITFVNPAFGAFYGQPEAQLLGTDFFQKLTPAEAATLREKLAALPDDLPVWSFDRRAVAADDHVEWQQNNLRRFARDGGKGFEYQAVIQNITQRKQAELALQEAKAALETKNLQLRNAVKEANAAAAEANRANAAKSEFLANMSHEIRTPLSGILGMVELLAQSRLEPRQKEFATAATESANALLHVINDVLDFSKIEAGKMTIAQENFSIRDIVDSVLENAATREPGKKINLAAIVRRDVPNRLVGDPIRLRQVLLNLVGNGIKFTERGEVVVRVQPQAHAQGRLKLRFEIIDTGIGLTPEQTRKLFQPFMQADTSSSRKFGGTGLGLAISRKIIELMGGRIGVHSAAGAGSTFWFELPLVVPPQPAIERSYPGLVFAQAFIAAPNASLRESLAERLRGWGMDCREVATKEELLRILRHDLRATVMPIVLCDDEMIEQGGADLRQRLAENRGQMQCVLLAGPTVMLDRDQNDLAQFASVLLKPVREQALFNALVDVVAGKKPEAVPPVHLPGDAESIRREPAAKHTPISSLRILAAEDHPFNRKLWQLMLDNFGARADWAENGREAVDKFRPGQYDAILMDCNMPEMDGNEATAAIRHLEEEHQVARRVRIIAITANALVGERERCLAAGMDDYLAKPFTAQQLYQSLLAAVPAPPPSDNDHHNGNNNFNTDQLEQLCGDLGCASVCDMAGDFLNELPDRLKEIHRLHAAAQWPELKRAAHTLKGLFALFGYRLLSETCLAIEQAAGEADGHRAGAALEGLAAEAEKAIAHLRDWRTSQPATA
jgi:PAS domain S-box-containing protein